MTKAEFISKLLPDTYEEVQYLQLDLDVTDLGIADILRNVNRSFPKNSRDRNKITSCEKAVAILCKSELLDPVSGILIIICGDDNMDDINIISEKYMVLTISESSIKTDDGIASIIERLTTYLIDNFKDEISEFFKFHTKYIYDAEEDDEEES